MESEEHLRSSLVADLTEARKAAGRMMRLDHLGRENTVWADQHKYINTLLTLLGY